MLSLSLVLHEVGSEDRLSKTKIFYKIPSNKNGNLILKF